MEQLYGIEYLRSRCRRYPVNIPAGWMVTAVYAGRLAAIGSGEELAALEKLAPVNYLQLVNEYANQMAVDILNLEYLQDELYVAITKAQDWVCLCDKTTLPLTAEIAVKVAAFKSSRPLVCEELHLELEEFLKEFPIPRENQLGVFLGTVPRVGYKGL